MDDGTGHWMFEDLATADAIDWAWRDQKADVLSNSWGGGPPSDAISRAFERASTQGRDRKGAVIVIAAGNPEQLDRLSRRPSRVSHGRSLESEGRA